MIQTFVLIYKKVGKSMAALAATNDSKIAAATRERILDTAERLFTENGFDATSMRMITGGAEVNLAAVNYHFGSKEQLFQEVFRRRLTWLNRERLRLLDELERQSPDGRVKPSQIVDAFFGTLIRMAEQDELGGRTFMRLIGRTLTEPSEFIRAFFAEEYAAVVERYKQALFTALPDVPKAEIVWRFHFMLGATSYAIAGTDALRIITDWGIPPQDDEEAPAKLLPRLMSFLLGGLRAPLPPAGP